MKARLCAVWRYGQFVEFEVVETPQQSRRSPASRARRFECANCGSIFATQTGRASAYCSAKCRTTADAVRYGRAKVLEYGSLAALPDDIRQALQYLVAHALGAGYDSGARRIPDETRAFVWERDNGKCVQCSGLGEEVDHIDGDSSDASNLRLLCKDCHHTVTNAHLQPIADRETLAYRDQMFVRMFSAEPVLACDGPVWAGDWRAWVKKHEVTS